MRKSAEERFFEKVEQQGDCWVWIAGRSSNGYGKFSSHYEGSRQVWVGAHRWSWQFFNGEIPAGLEMDHLCRNRACVNPSHLEPVSSKTNKRRGLLSYELRTLCRSGRHDITNPSNVLYKKGKKPAPQCYPCTREGWDRYNRKRSAGDVQTVAGI